MKKTFAGKVRKIMQDLKGREISTQDIAVMLDMVSDADKRVLYRILIDFRHSDEIERVKKGVYIYKGKKCKPQLQEVMWRVLRDRRKVTVDDLVEMAGAEESYVKEWLQMLVRREIVRKYKNGNYLMIKDPVDMPRNEEKAQKLRRIRAKKKKALDALDKAVTAALEARMAVVEIEE